MFGFLRNYFSNDIAIDLGTANTLIYMRGKGIVSTNRVSLPFAKKEVLTVKLRFMPSAEKPSKCLGVFLATSAPFDR